MRKSGLYAVCLLLLVTTLCGAWQESFEGATRWETPGGERIAPVAEAGKTGLGLRVAAAEGEARWAISPELPGPKGDWQILVFDLKRLSGRGALLLGMSGEGGFRGEPEAVWSTGLPEEGRWVRVELVLSPPPGGQWRVALGAEGPAGWAVDNLALAEVRRELNPPTPLPRGIAEASYPEGLPPDWEPEGTLDARVREVGNLVELLVNVLGVAISLPAEVEVVRGYREGPQVHFSNPGTVNREVEVTVQGPGEGWMPRFSLPVRGGGTTVFRLPTPVMREGEHWRKLTFAAGGASASVPLKVKARRSYPALGRLGGGEAGGLPVGFVVGEVALGRGQDTAEGVPEGAELLRVSIPPAEQAVGGGEGLLAEAREMLARWRPGLAQLGWRAEGWQPSGEEIAEAYALAWEEVFRVAPETALVSPAWALAPGRSGLQMGPDLAAALERGLGAQVNSLGVRVSELPAGGVLMERIDGRNPATANPGWARLGERLGFRALREELQRRDVHLPLLVELAAASGQARPGLEQMARARLLLDAAWAGLTGVVLEEEPAGAPGELLEALWPELAGAQPLYLPESPGGYCTSGPESPLTGWAFLRGREGIVFVANNTSAVQQVEVGLRSSPEQMQILRLSAFGAQPIRREMQGAFRFSEEARERHKEAIYLRLAPGEIVGVSLLLLGAHAGWLQGIAPMPPAPGQSQLEQPSMLRDNPWFSRRAGPLEF